ncbi:hypothetical protein HUG10_11300 [Halorarum halophilum]|uniref:Uncharacterized protein n=1 Tax=Halorarum halophilum TaxID=2743090 RepID=A0A7D5L2T9_9EURY|nr:hypothetical protein [Halobaculum halophilum]QLG28103.1 hypothetical protein HUG10_11300 [Halobaculum halophilum]
MAAAGTVDWLRPRLRLVGGAVLVGTALGLVAGGAVAVFLSLRAVRSVFALGALVLGVGVLGWSGSAMAGRGIETMHRYMDTGSDWTEENSRRAMARVGGAGAGVMLGSGLVEVVMFV